MSNANLPAFPVSANDRANYEAGGYVPNGVFGLTKREYFAAKAMQGLCADPNTGDLQYGDIARVAVGLADALIAELEKQP